jgi:hypothetical protein
LNTNEIKGKNNMNKRTTILLIGVLLIALPVLAIMKSNSYKFENTLGSEKCSSEIEGLKLCVENPKVVVNSGEQVRIKLFWVNTSDADRRIGNRSTDYSVTVKDKNGKKLIPVYEQRFMERLKQMRESGEKDKGLVARVISGSYKGLYADANGIEKDEIRLTEKMYDYDLTSKGIYHVTISKKVASLEKGKTIEFVLNDIEIQVK